MNTKYLCSSSTLCWTLDRLCEKAGEEPIWDLPMGYCRWYSKSLVLPSFFSVYSVDLLLFVILWSPWTSSSTTTRRSVEMSWASLYSAKNSSNWSILSISHFCNFSMQIDPIRLFPTTTASLLERPTRWLPSDPKRSPSSSRMKERKKPYIFTTNRIWRTISIPSKRKKRRSLMYRFLLFSHSLRSNGSPPSIPISSLSPPSSISTPSLRIWRRWWTKKSKSIHCWCSWTF